MNISLKTVLIIFAGSGAGGVLRYLVQRWVVTVYPYTFPWGTFAVNIAGCLLIGLFYAFSDKGNMMSPDWRIALTTGLCGGFTTFSTFAWENMNLLRTGDYAYFGLYTAGSVVLGIAAVFAGVAVVKML